MKKIVTLLLVITVFLTGCSMMKKMESPKEKVAAYLESYQKLDDNVLTDLDLMVDEMDIYNDNQKERYKKIIKNHYENLKYELKDEVIDGNNATVEVEIDVYDYSNALDNTLDMDEFKDENGEYDLEAYYDHQLDLLESIDEKIKYTVIFNLSKEDKEWVIEEPSETMNEKIHGIYAY